MWLHFAGHTFTISKNKSDAYEPRNSQYELKTSAVKLAIESEKPVTHVAWDIGINVNTLHT